MITPKIGFIVYGVHKDGLCDPLDIAIVGGGLTLRRNACLSLDLNYDLQINERSQFHIAYGGIERKY